MNDLRELAAGVLCVGFDGTGAADVGSVLRRTPFAGLILFGRNVVSPEQTRALTDAIRDALPSPIIAVDQEGGRVARLRRGVEELPAMLALAATGDTDLAERAGMQLAFDLRRAGVNVNYAPVLDLMLMKMNTVIGSRAFGDDPQRVIAFAGAFARGMQSQGIVPTFKHFPGHGSTEVDSHLDLPVVDLPEERLRARDLAPFAQLLPGAQAVMTAHIVVQSLDPHLPATLSPRLLTDVLRDEIGFTGVCFTDCMQMNAIADSVGSAEGAVQALIAGADCVLVSHSVDCALESIDRVVWAVEQGRLPRERLEQAHARVRRLRAGLQAPLPLDAHPPHAGVGREIGRRAVTLLRGSAAVQRENAAVISFEGATVEGVQGLHSDHAILIDDASSRRALPLEPEVSEVDGALAFLRARQKRPVVLLRRAHVYPSQAQAVRRIIDEFPETILVSTREPFDAFLFDAARNVMCTYGDDKPSMEGLGDVLFGGARASGSFPLSGYPQTVAG